MGCFYLLKLKVKLKKWKQVKSTTTSRSDDSGVPKQSSKSSGSASSHQSISSLYEEKGHNLRVFRYRELRDATNDFSRLQKIGEGGFGSVYKGFVKPPSGKGDNITVAVKKLNPNSLQGHKQWLAEVHFLGVVEHPNLVKLIGYCAIDGERGVQRLLVYEFMQNKSLEDHLFGRVYPSLPWNLRLQIALGAAEGLTYLHEGLEVQIIYRDFKASNVLLDEEFHPKLSDFGLAREGPSAGDTHVSTAVMGTYGYAAPDYIETGHLTEKSDVWSFGVVLYEILTGRKSMERNRPRNEQKLLDWVKRYPVDRKRFSTVMDPRLKNNYSMRAAKEIAKLANTCLSRNARDRPKMWEVAEGIKRAMEYKEMDGGDEISASATENEKQVEEEEEEEETGGGESESTRRRMLHLAKLRETANVLGIGRKRPLFMKFAEPM